MNKVILKRSMLVFVFSIVMILSSFSLALADENGMGEDYLGGFMYEFLVQDTELVGFECQIASLNAANIQGGRISAGGSSSFVIMPDYSLWSWGRNIWGEVGDGTAIGRFNPIKIMDNVAMVSNSSGHTMAIRNDGSLWAWGNNSSGQLGDGTIIDRHAPVWIMDDVVSVEAGIGYTMVIKTDGSLWAWGVNNRGQLGDGTTLNRHSPVWIMDDVAAVSAAQDHTAAIKTDGSLWAWGFNINGQIGDGTTINRYNPVWIMDDVAAISTGVGGHTMAVGSDGSLWGWGFNWFGQIGDGTTIDRHSPVQIMDNVVSVEAGIMHTIVIRADGSLWGWGFNQSGTLGDGTATNQYSPIWIMDDVTAVSAISHAVAIRSDGSLWAWGGNQWGQIGDGTTINRHSPVKITPPVIGAVDEWLIGTVGQPFNYTLQVTGARPITWSWVCGELPLGLNFNMETGEISGVPTEAGEFWYLVRASNFGGDSYGQELNIRIQPDDLIYISAPHITAAPGSYIDITISLNGLHDGLSSLSFDLSYDATILERVGSIELGCVFDASIIQPPIGANPFRVNLRMMDILGVTHSTGDLATVRFRVLDNVEPGVTVPIELSVVSAYRIENFMLAPVNVASSNGSVHVVNNIMFGDVNGDGMITDADLLMLRMYLAGHPVSIDRQAADVNVDGQITSADELLLAMYLAGHPVVLGPQSNPGPAQLQPAAFNGFEIIYLLDAHGVFDEDLLSQDALAGFEATYSENYSDSKSSVEYVDVVISLNENEGISTLSLGLNYDASVLQRVSIAPADIMLMPIEPPASAYPFAMNFSLSDPLAFTGDTGNLVTVRFRVLDNAALETTSITLGVNSAYRIENFSPVPINAMGLEIQTILQDGLSAW